MSRIATWRRGPNDPDTVRRWLWGVGPTVARRPGSPPDPKQVRLAVAGIVTYAVTLVVLFATHHRTLAPAANAVLFFLSNRVSSKRKTEASVPPEEPEGVRVQVSIEDRKRVRTGTDRGRLILCDGWLLFEGERTDFAFSRGEAVAPKYEAFGRLRLEDRRWVAFSSTDDIVLRVTLRRWESMPIPEGEAVLPPVEPHPERWVERHSLWIFGAVTCATVVGFGIAFRVGVVFAVGALGLIGFLSGAAGCAERLRQELPRILTSAPSRKAILAEAEASATFVG